MIDEGIRTRRWRHILRRHSWWVLTTAAYAAITSATVAWSQADAIDYIGSIVGELHGGGWEFWEFGHVLWRPLGYITYRVASSVIERLTGSDPTTGVIGVLLAWSWLAGLAGALALNRFVSRLRARPWCIPIVTFAYIVNFGVLNYAHSGSSYIPGLACLLVALALLVDRDDISVGTAIATGIALAGAVGFWALYILVIPATLAFPLVWFGLERRRWWLACLVTMTFVLVLGSAYALAIQRLGIRDLAGLKSWVSASSHGISNVRGLPRAAFGIPRSFLSMGNDGVLFKRYLINDPYNPVSLGELVRLSLAKVALFYVMLLATLAGLLRGKAERRVLLVALLGGIPVLAFGVSWQGGDVERYMPAYPLVFAAWAMVLGGTRPMRLIQALVLLFVVVMSAVNLPALSRATAERDRARLQRRVGDLRPLLGPEDRVFVVMIQDPLYAVKRDPCSLISRDLKIVVLVPLGSISSANWRRDFANSVQATWASGGRVWLTKRVLSRRPKAEWDWSEGDEKNVSWSDLHSFFGALEFGHDLGGEDGFIAVSHTPRNERLLERTAAPSRTDRSGSWNASGLRMRMPYILRVAGAGM